MPPSARERADRARLCEKVGVLRTCDPDAAERLAARERSGEDPATLLDDAGGAVAEPTGPGPARGSRLPVMPRPTPGVFVCPDDLCDRVVAKRPSMQRPPDCELRGGRLTLVRY